MSDKRLDLFVKLKTGPAALFLGQNYLQLESGTDPFLSAIIQKYGNDSHELDYHQILRGIAHESIESSLPWMYQLSKRIAIPNWLKTVSGYAWCNVYTSAIDVVWPRAFISKWRELEYLFEEKYNPANPRNRLRLLCTFLFGNVGRSDENERMPLTDIEFIKRQQVAISLARRLPEILTPFGTLIIEAYHGNKDWFSTPLMLPILDSLNPGQSYIFSFDEEMSQDSHISYLINSGKLIPFRESLETLLLEAESDGSLKLGSRPEDADLSSHVYINNEVFEVPQSIWNQTSMSCTILNNRIVAPQSPISNEKLYQEFRSFLGNSRTVPIWSSYERGLAFEREFEKNLRKKVDKKLKSKELQREPIIIYGQTGTSKSIALGYLSYNICKEKKYPVLFIGQKSQIPSYSDIDIYCKWAEDCGAYSSVVVWDGMVDVDQYYELVKYLTGRGRKVTIVGSIYKTSDRSRQSNFIEAPAHLNNEERPLFIEFINKFDNGLSKFLASNPKNLEDDNFLVALYRLLPASRRQLQDGLIDELRQAETELLRKVTQIEIVPTSTLAYALWKANIQVDILSEKTKQLAGEDISEPQELVGLIMVPGRFGLNIPLELLMRASGKTGIMNLVELLKDIDIIKWDEDTLGNFSIGPRHPLEAKLICQARLGGPKAEIIFANKLIREIMENTREMHFTVELIRNMGPNSQSGKYYVKYLPDIVDALRDVREKRGIENPRLMLQEATMLREFIVSIQDSDNIDNVYELLDQAETTIRKAIDLIESDNAQFRSFGLVELASILGTKVYKMIESHRNEEAIRISLEIQKIISEAWNLNNENVYSIDVLGWTSENIIQADIIDLKTRGEIEAAVNHAFMMTQDIDYGFIQRERINSRRMKIGYALKKNELTNEAFEELISIGSNAGYYLKALNMINNIQPNTILDAKGVNLCREAFNYLNDNKTRFLDDSRCLYLLFRIWWMLKNGKPLFFEERQTVPFEQEDWQYCQNIILQLLKTDEKSSPILKYLLGISAFHLNQLNDTFDFFRDLERETHYTQGRRRIIRHYLASNPDGSPKVYNGTVVWANPEGSQGSIYIEDLLQKINFIPRDFGRPQISSHETISNFHIAFNYIGPIADPEQYLRK